MIATIIASCKHDDSKTASPAPVGCYTDTVNTVSFARDIVPVLRQNCALSGCHTGSAPTGNLNLDSGIAYAALMKPGTGYINTATPTASLLYSQLTSTADPMPPTGKLDNCTISLVLKWIQQQAPNN
ncbi:hypothetical protein [Taibaiella soli]|uniref:Cytochrome C Planctomycete-type domain-containing protein n=1 Tax=Taibaiella soli TaxID=1649169 RepID=A0A2W2BYD9_9BACT|nr:hypothetical protein [Taibaiella soli]PZF72883.1 hypothetical protein DN068_10750 [Taibaiella soli]